MKKLKVNLMMIFALVVGAVAMSFQSSQPTFQSFEWHARQPDGTYVLMPGNPSSEPSNGCVPIGDELCAKGFEPGTAPSVITDETEAEDRYVDE